MGKRSSNLDSLYQLLKGRVFNQRDYRAWLLYCMEHATLPIRQKFSLVINEFVQSTFLVDQVEKIPEEIIEPYFKDCSKTKPTRILLLLYLSSYNDFIIASKTEPNVTALVNSTNLQKEKLIDTKIKELIGYIVNDNMNLAGASRKDPNYDIPVVGTLDYGNCQSYTNDQVKKLIHYIKDDDMITLEPSFKVSMSLNTANKYYRQYLNNPSHKIPTFSKWTT